MANRRAAAPKAWAWDAIAAELEETGPKLAAKQLSERWIASSQELGLDEVRQ